MDFITTLVKEQGITSIIEDYRNSMEFTEKYSKCMTELLQNNKHVEYFTNEYEPTVEIRNVYNRKGKLVKYVYTKYLGSGNTYLLCDIENCPEFDEYTLEMEFNGKWDV